jgi:23S rRNA (adenine2503-C2)-methyltransferase
MGIGEPLDNFTNAVKAIKILREPLGLNFTKRRICVSTCGLIPEIKGLGRLKLGIKLSISLHSANNAQRSKIMPINKKYPLSELINAAREFAKYEKYPVTFEYALISEINSKPKDALELARLLKHINCKVNLIPYNCSCLGFKAAGPREIKIFSEILKKAGIFFTLRKSRGQDISAACGQLQAAWV